ncbi:hypothetical protein OG948_33010 [Embleya sp. NBC_00888]|uniref:hypothetical protein n=1 Tax=Embleya sp. NBC_00888 TaxID=2975960 RepID=UPI0038643DAB|nr:hypothetical protein OG948_33010 [Embleya sp. NBC_00888]
MSTDETAQSRTGSGPARLPRRTGGRRRVTKVLMSEDEYARVSAKAADLAVSIPRLLVESAFDDAPTATERRAFYAELLAVRRQLARLSEQLSELGADPAARDATTPGWTDVVGRLSAVLDRLDPATGYPSASACPRTQAP